MQEIIGKQFNRQDNKITIFFKDDNGNVEVFYYPFTDEIFELAKTNNINKLLELKKPKLALKNIFGDIIEKNQNYYLEGTNIPMPSNLVKVILNDYSKNYNVDSLIKFWQKSLKCKNIEAAKSLYDFLEANNMPITNEGNVVAWKRVRTKNKKGLEVSDDFYGVKFYAGKVWKDNQEVDKDLEQRYLTWLHDISEIDLVDCYTGTFINNVGSVVEFKGTPDYNRNNTCSPGGLHVANEEYARNFYNDASGVLIMVEFSPEDVISCPVDHNFAKLRVFKYKVLSVVPE